MVDFGARISKNDSLQLQFHRFNSFRLKELRCCNYISIKIKVSRQKIEIFEARRIICGTKISERNIARIAKDLFEISFSIKTSRSSFRKKIKSVCGKQDFRKKFKLYFYLMFNSSSKLGILLDIFISTLKYHTSCLTVNKILSLLPTCCYCYSYQENV